MRTRDVQATLLRLTSQSLAEAVIRYAPGPPKRCTSAAEAR